MSKKKVVEIKSWLTGNVLATGEEGETMADLVTRKVAERADLNYASLDGASLDGASLDGARLDGARLDGASLVGASLDGARLDGASLVGASLVGASLVGASLDGARLPSPTAVLLAYWPNLSPQLVADLMLFDSTCHPDPTAFDRWAAGGDCPYADVYVQRAVNFPENKSLWGKGQPCRPYDLMTRVLAETCPEWTKEQVAEFAAKFKK
jgi:hypothetical protein